MQIAFHGLPPSTAVEAKIREKAAWLERFSDDITSCRVVVELPHRHQHRGRLFHVRVNLTVGDAKLVTSREPQEHHAHEDVYVALRDAFDAARRQLEDYERRRSGPRKGARSELGGS